MELKSERTVPCHLIAGPLGVGKTTAVRRLVEQTPGFTAVIVNDFGETGYDAALISETAGPQKLQVENIPGGCLCCTTAAQLLPALKTLSGRPEIDRIIIEPSGVALLDPLLKMLHEAAPECGFELRPVIVLFDPAKIRPAAIELIPYWRHLADRADIAVINRCDLVPAETVDVLFRCLEKRMPPKLRIVKTSHGQLPPDLLELKGTVARPGDEPHGHADLPPAGTFRSDKTFRLEALLNFLEEIAPQTERFKGIFQTDRGWIRLEISGGNVIQRSAAPAAQSSADWVGSEDLSARIFSLQK